VCEGVHVLLLLNVPQYQMSELMTALFSFSSCHLRLVCENKSEIKFCCSTLETAPPHPSWGGGRSPPSTNQRTGYSRSQRRRRRWRDRDGALAAQDSDATGLSEDITDAHETQEVMSWWKLSQEFR